jgi:lipopolysaccharide export system permease protein
MIKTFEKYLIKLFLKKMLNISLIFLSLVFILSIFEEITFFQNSEVNFFFPFFLTLLNAPSTLFEIFPFIFLISSQFFFLELINKNELEVLKTNGLDNFKVIKILFFTSFCSSPY